MAQRLPRLRRSFSIAILIKLLVSDRSGSGLYRELLGEDEIPMTQAAFDKNMLALVEHGYCSHQCQCLELGGVKAQYDWYHITREGKTWLTMES